MKAPKNTIVDCYWCNGVGDTGINIVTPCANCDGVGTVSLTPREKRLAEALNGLLPLVDDLRRFSRFEGEFERFHHEKESAQEAARAALREAGYTD